MANNAAPEGQKIATATQEVIRRFKNTSRDLPAEEIETILKDYMDELIWGGYDANFRVKILSAAITGYIRMWNDQREGKGYINRPEAASRTTRRWKNCVERTLGIKRKGRATPRAGSPGTTRKIIGNLQR